MTRTVLENLVQECIKSILCEINGDVTKGGKSIMAIGAPGSKKRNMATADPSAEEMTAFLKSQYGNEEGFDDSAAEAMYWFANFNHGGQSSNLYSVVSTSPFNPGPIARGPEKDSMSQMMFDSLEQEYGKGLSEDGAAAAPGGMSVTGNVQGYMTPRAFKHPKDTKANNEATGGEDESQDPKDAYYVEYVGPYGNEQSFTMKTGSGPQKFEYCMGQYPDGKKDIAVYSYAGDMCIGYKAFRKSMGINEEEQFEPYDAETDEFAPGPRSRPEQWDSPEIPPVQHTKLSELVPTVSEYSPSGNGNKPDYDVQRKQAYDKAKRDKDPEAMAYYQLLGPDTVANVPYEQFKGSWAYEEWKKKPQVISRIGTIRGELKKWNWMAERKR